LEEIIWRNFMSANSTAVQNLGFSKNLNLHKYDAKPALAFNASFSGLNLLVNKRPAHFLIGTTIGPGAAALVQRSPSLFKSFNMIYWDILRRSPAQNRVLNEMGITLKALKMKSQLNTAGAMIGLAGVGIALTVLLDDMRNDAARTGKGYTFGNSTYAFGRSSMITAGATLGAFVLPALLNLTPAGKSLWAIPTAIGTGAVGARLGTAGAEVLCDYMKWQ
jgi:hypothetical protein